MFVEPRRTYTQPTNEHFLPPLHKPVQDPKTSVSRAVLDHVDMSTALLSRAARVADTHVFNLKLDYETSPITNQLSSGRCWLFASTNVIRYEAAQKLKIKDFQLSQVGHVIICLRSGTSGNT